MEQRSVGVAPGGCGVPTGLSWGAAWGDSPRSLDQCVSAACRLPTATAGRGHHPGPETRGPRGSPG